MKHLITKCIGLYFNVLAMFAPRIAGKKLFELFCRPFRKPINNKQAAFLNAAALKKFDFKGTSLQLYRWGNGPKSILLVHGWQSHTYRWKAYIEAIDQQQYSVYAFDAPGHGQSQGNFLNLPLYSEAIKEVSKIIGEIDCIVGHSLGSFSTLHLLHHQPTVAVNKVVVTATPGEVHEFFGVFQRTLQLSDRSVKAMLTYFEAHLKQPPTYFSAPVFASSLTVPGLIIHDEEDLEAPVLHSSRLHEAWVNSQLKVTRGLGHNLKSIDVVTAVVEFINQPLRHVELNSMVATNQH